MPWPDLAIVAVIAGAALLGVRRGFVLGVLDLLAIAAPPVLAYLLADPLGAWIAAAAAVAPAVGRAGAFLAAWVALTIVVGAVAALLGRAAGGVGARSPVDRILGLIPGAAKGLLTVAVAVALVAAIPGVSGVREDVEAAPLGGHIVGAVEPIEHEAASLLRPLGSVQRVREEPRGAQFRRLPFTDPSPTPHPVGEQAMLALVNEARAKAGVPPLTVADDLRRAARMRSADMLRRGYFGHITPDGESPFDLMARLGIRFRMAGENLALAPTVRRAHAGLMNSPGHRRNILQPNFGRVGIGVLRSRGGLMITQLFAD